MIYSVIVGMFEMAKDDGQWIPRPFLIWAGLLLLGGLLWIRLGPGHIINRIFWTTVVLLILFGALLAVYSPMLPVPSLLEPLAHAFIIAGLLAGTVDFFLKDRMLREVSLDASKFLVGYSLPSEVQNAIREILQTAFIRRNCEIRVRITEIEGRAGFVQLDMELVDEVENITNEPKRYRDKLEWEKHDPQTVLQMRCDSSDASAQYCFGPGQLKVSDKEGEPGVLIAWGNEVTLPSYDPKVDIRYRFTAKYRVVHPENYSDIVAFGRPTIDAALIVECPEGFTVTAPVATFWSENRWQYNRLFLPGDHIRFRWSRNASVEKA